MTHHFGSEIADISDSASLSVALVGLHYIWFDVQTQVELEKPASRSFWVILGLSDI